MGRPRNERFCYHVFTERLPITGGAGQARTVFLCALYNREDPKDLESENPADWFEIAAMSRLHTTAECLAWVRNLILKFEACDIWTAAVNMKRVPEAREGLSSV